MKKHIVPIIVGCLIVLLLGGVVCLVVPGILPSSAGGKSSEEILFRKADQTPSGEISDSLLTVTIPETKPLGEKIAEEQARIEAERAAEEAAREAREAAEKAQGFDGIMDVVDCTSAALYRLRDDYLGGLVAEKNADEILAPASTTKLMTALLTAELCPDLTATMTIPTDVWEDFAAVDASTSGFSSGQEVTVEDVLYGILLPSGCDTCVAAARYISGSEEAFADLMNQKAAELGMTNTHYITCHGLYVDGHYTTANDMIKLLKACYENETIRKVMTTAEHTASDGHVMQSTTLARFGDYDLDESVTILGGKTGYSKMVGQNLCTAAEINGEVYLLVTLGCHGNPYTGGLQHFSDQTAIWNALAAAYRSGEIVTEAVD